MYVFDVRVPDEHVLHVCTYLPPKHFFVTDEQLLSVYAGDEPHVDELYVVAEHVVVVLDDLQYVIVLLLEQYEFV